MGKKLDSIVTVSSGFQAAVNLKANIDDDQKVSCYIPTGVSSEILEDLASGFHTTSTRRSRLINGTYGTGKSHLALVIARIFRDGTEHQSLLPVMEKLKKWNNLSEKLRAERSSRKGKFLLVNLLGDAGDFKDTLLRELDKALSAANMSDIFPDTAYCAAIRRIEQIRSHSQNHYDQLVSMVTEYGFVSIDALIAKLNDKSRSSYDLFIKMHEELFAGAKFNKNHNMNPEEVYKEVARRIVSEKDYAGIVVIWDEFGRYLERIVEQPHGQEGEAIQNFADGCCNLVGEDQVHLYLLCHRTLKEYGTISSVKRLTNVSQYEISEWKKIEGRFTQFAVKTSAHEIFNLIDQVIVQKEDTTDWADFVKITSDRLDEETDFAKKFNLFPEFDRDEIQSTVTLGCYPLHPMAAFCLPLISQKVGQDNRTLFTFLSDGGSGTFGPFLQLTEISVNGSRPPFFTADLLWDYFSIDMEKDPLYKRIFTKFSQADVRVAPDDIFGKQIIKVIALLQVLNSDRALPKEDIISYCLALDSVTRQVLKDKLKSFCNKESGMNSVLNQSLDGLYRFTGVVADNFTSELESTVETRKIKPIAHLRSLLKSTSYSETNIQASRYNLDYYIERKLIVECVSVEELDSPERWTNNLGSGDFVDGYALVVICEDINDISKAQEYAQKKLCHPQIMIAIPKSGVKIFQFLRYHDAIKYLLSSNPAMYGKGAPLNEEWEEHYRDYTDHINKEILSLFKPDNERLDYYFNGELAKNIRSKSHLGELASQMMEKVFGMTPVIAHDKLTTDEGNDSFKGNRQAVVEKVLLKEAPTLLSQETLAPCRNIIDNFYKRNGILKLSGNTFKFEKPAKDDYPKMFSVWECIEQSLAKAKSNNGIPLPMSDIVDALRKPPYGLRIRSIPLLVAAVFRHDNLLGNISLLEGAKRVEKLTGDSIDRSVFSCKNIKLHYETFGEVQKAVLYGVADAFGLDISKEKDKGELVSEIQDRFKSWWFSLSRYSQTTNKISKTVMVIRDTIFKKLVPEDSDVYRILMQDLVMKIQPPAGQRITEQLVSSNFIKWKTEIESAVDNHLLPDIKSAISEIFESNTNMEWHDSISAWWKLLDKDKQEVRIPGDPQDLSRLCSESSDTTFDELQLKSLSEKFSGLDLSSWNDDTLQQFKGCLRGAKRTIDSYVPEKETITPLVGTPPPPGKIIVSIQTDGSSLTRTFVTVDQISSSGINFKNAINGVLCGMGPTLPSGECETILFGIIQEYLK